MLSFEGIPTVIFHIIKPLFLTGGVLLALSILAEKACGQGFEGSLLRVENCREDEAKFCQEFQTQFEDWKKGLLASPTPELRWMSMRLKASLRKEGRKRYIEVEVCLPGKKNLYMRREVDKASPASAQAFAEFRWLFSARILPDRSP